MHESRHSAGGRAFRSKLLHGLWRSRGVLRRGGSLRGSRAVRVRKLEQRVRVQLTPMHLMERRCRRRTSARNLALESKARLRGPHDCRGESAQHAPLPGCGPSACSQRPVQQAPREAALPLPAPWRRLPRPHSWLPRPATQPAAVEELARSAPPDKANTQEAERAAGDQRRRVAAYRLGNGALRLGLHGVSLEAGDGLVLLPRPFPKRTRLGDRCGSHAGPRRLGVVRAVGRDVQQPRRRSGAVGVRCGPAQRLSIFKKVSST